ncbi:MAG: helix-turn-helix transcriptional regulator [Lachnospiraceae bacterium]|nr:helix-turn-helix transcriptional regulator [Lachnospiraceae bacterium]
MEQLKKLRQAHHISQQKLADEFHISQQSIWKYENDISEPDINMLIQFSNYFNVSVDYLIGNSEVPTKADLIAEKQLSPDETTLIKSFRSLSTKMQALTLGLLNEITNNPSDT